jgi:L-fuculose-phosphate aldolase
MADKVQEMREKICKFGRLMFDRQLTDTAGGNISARVGNQVCITPRYSGAKFQWNLRPEQVLVTNLQGKKLEGEGEISRESKVHYNLYDEFPEGNGIVHAHASNVMVFCAAGIPIPPVIEATLKFGEIGFSDFFPAHSTELARSVAEKMHLKEDALKKQAAAVMAPWHGLFVLGKDIDAAFDAMVRIDGNARILLMSSLLESIYQDAPGLHKRMLQLKTQAAKFGK